METKYLHYRHFDRDGRPEPKRGATVAYRIENGLLLFSVAGVHHKDNFSRKQGRFEALKKAILYGEIASYIPTKTFTDQLDLVNEFRGYMDEVMYKARRYRRRVRAK